MAFEGLDRIGQIALHVGNVERATDFYRDTLGMRYLFSAPPGMAFFDCGGVRLLIGEPEGGDGGGGGEGAGGEGAGDEGADGEEAGGSTSSDRAVDGGTILYFDVPDIHAAHEALSGRGARFVEEPRKVAEHEGTALWLAFFRDPWGNVLALMSEVAR